MRRSRFALLGLCLVLLTAALAVRAGKETPPSREAADQAFELKNYRDAAQVYAALLEGDPKGEPMHHASRRLIVCHLRLQLFDDAIAAAEGYIERTRGTPHEARAERLLGNLYLTMPHWGTRSGGKFRRGQYGQGIRLRSNRFDKERARQHMERARELYARYDAAELRTALESLPEEERAGWHEERIECSMDLAAICGRFGIYENEWRWWWGFWGERDDLAAETAGEQDFQEYYADWQLRRKRPIGLRVDARGRPIFPVASKSYESARSDDQRILYLLTEARDLDRTPNHKYRALSLFRQAMLARTRFGMDRLNSYAGTWWSGGRYPLQEEIKKFNPWELKDDQALILAGGKLVTAKLPEAWNVVELLRRVSGDYAESGVAAEAQYSLGLYHQSRQQYTTALDEYASLKKRFPDSAWTKNSETPVSTILRSEARIHQTGVQLPGQPAKLQVSYRNAKRIWFVARRIDAEGFLRAIRATKLDDRRGFQDFWALGNWHHYFVRAPGQNEDQRLFRLAAEHVGEEAGRWSDEVTDDGSRRYASATIQAPIDGAGTYLVYAYLAEPPAGDGAQSGPARFGLGVSRAVVSLTDLAMVDKRTSEGVLYYICDARSGAPVAGVEVGVLEYWSIWNRQKKKSEYFKRMHELRTDEQGFAHLKRDNQSRGRLHVLATVGKKGTRRIGWSGMSYWSRYNPSRMRDGLFAYCITDRPVYRPNQTVKYKVWLRHMREGQFEDPPSRNVSVTIYDARGNKVLSTTHRTDQFGGFDGELKLGDEPRLGMYRLQVSGQTYYGGGNFRVEEYKKPEFEVSVEPGASHVKLGDKVKAQVQATYYFGAPVTEATVAYKVFREEYRHGYYFPGPWDWLYGPGYGYAWYDYDWFPWWGWVKCCRVAPGWWWSFGGRSAPNPVRELVAQGDGALDENGSFEVEIDTAPAARDHGDRDHRYVVQADVRDSSRRVISGEGAVKVTRQAYYTAIRADRGYYRPGQEMEISIRCLTPDNEPIRTEGIVTVSEVVFGGRDNRHIQETELSRFKAATDERGLHKFRLRHERSGQIKIRFESPDSWGGQVQGFGLVWVVGDDFDGSLHRFNDLEILTDKRTYQPGEVAHVMVNTKRAGSWVLFSDRVDNNHLLDWKLLHLPQRSMVLDVPVEKGHAPNFFVEATTVADTRVHQQALRICVPPEEGVMSVTVATDKPSYEPGEKATVTVTAKGPDGKPVEAQITLSAFDKSVLYIQEELTPSIARFFHGNLRYHSIRMATNLLEQFAAAGHVSQPYLYLYPQPSSWWGIWGPQVGDWSSFRDKELRSMTGATRNLPGEAAGEEAEESLDESIGIGGGAGGDRRGRGGKRRKSEDGAPSAPAEAKRPAGETLDREFSKDDKGGGALVEAEVRKRFADTALWLTTLTTDESGKATATVEMPDNLTTWKINTWGITKSTRVGQANTSAITTKKLLVRLQAPRFFMELDEVVVSANVHNYLDEAKRARVNLELPAELLERIGDTPLEVDVDVPAGGEHRVDWRVRVRQEGIAQLTVKARTDEESDAMQMSFPVLVHGMTKQVATTGSMRPDQERTVTVELNVPMQRRPELTRLEVQFAPTLVGAMLDALPYCLDYPYGCTEQTMSRFLPAVLTLKTLQGMGLKLEDLRKVREGRMAELKRIAKGENRRIWSCYADSPVFDEAEMRFIIQKGLARIGNMQNGDGGWGWWAGNQSSPYLSSYVLFALLTARECDVAIDENLIQRGLNWLTNRTVRDMRNEYWAPHSAHAFAAYVLSMAKREAVLKPNEEDKRPPKLVDRLFEGRDKLNLYGKALLGLALDNLGDRDRAVVLLDNTLQFLERNEETQVAWLRTPRTGWWYWYNSDIETNAWFLRLVTRLRPKDEMGPHLVKWLLNNRRNGYYWRSTRDTTFCIAAMSDFVRASGEGAPDYTLRLELDDGAVVKEVRFDKDNIFTADNRFVVEGVALDGGRHTLKISKRGKGALYFNTYLRYFTKEPHITASGHELKVERSYFRLEQIPFEVEVEGADGQTVKEKRLRYERVPVKHGDAVKSGELIQVELKVKSDNTYTYLAFEDMKPAGFEAVEVRSGGKGQEGFWSYMELRDEKVAFFVDTLAQGEHLMRYRLRAEIPGVFHALPTRLFAMYVPELRANSEEQIIRVLD